MFSCAIPDASERLPRRRTPTNPNRIERLLLLVRLSLCLCRSHTLNATRSSSSFPSPLSSVDSPFSLHYLILFTKLLLFQLLASSQLGTTHAQGDDFRARLGAKLNQFSASLTASLLSSPQVLLIVLMDTLLHPHSCRLIDWPANVAGLRLATLVRGRKQAIHFNTAMIIRRAIVSNKQELEDGD